MHRLVIFLLLASCSSSENEAPASTDTGTVAVDSTTPVDTAVTSETAPETSSEVAADTAEASTDTGTSICAMEATGDTCSDTQPCPGSALCYGFGKTGFCAPAEPQCGGFVMKPCPGGRTCLRASGSSLGYCATDEEKLCICSKKADAGFTVDGC